MPVVHVNLVEGRDPEMLDRLLRGVSEVVCRILEISPATVSVILHEVPAALTARGLTTRSVPSGRAKLAWTCVEGDLTLAIAVSGHGAEAARLAAGFWMPRARRVISLGLAAETGLVSPPALVMAGDDGL